MKTPVLVIGYNRPELMQGQLDFLLSKVKVQKVWISIDGAKKNSESKQKVLAVQKVVRKFQKKYPGKVLTQFSAQNLGCRKGVEKALNWFFGQNTLGIILEDDCVPDLSFFPYVTELLEKYKTDTRVGMIAGTNPLVKTATTSSYFFSYQTLVWGWATWRRAWLSYQTTASKGLEALQTPVVRASVLERTTRKHLKIIEKVLTHQIDTWDYIWYLSNILESRVNIVPNSNLISNVGFSDDATHTKLKTTQSRLPVIPLHFPLKHPDFLSIVPAFEKSYLAQIETANVIWSVLQANIAWEAQRLAAFAKNHFGTTSK
jgi:hypothetical protein